MKITQEVRDFAASAGVAEGEAIEAGLRQKSEDFRREGGEIYKKV